MKYRAKNRPRRQSRPPKKQRRRRKLLKSACAGLLSIGLGDGVAEAFEIDEATSSLAVDGDFVDLGDGTLLPPGVTSIRGTVGLSDDSTDRFRLADLPTGSPFSLVADFADNHQFGVFGADFAFLDVIFEPAGGLFDAAGTYRTIVPGDGIIEFQVGEGEGGSSEGAYTLTLSVVPEPSTGAIAAMGAAALLGLARRKQD